MKREAKRVEERKREKSEKWSKRGERERKRVKEIEFLRWTEMPPGC